MSHDLEGTSAHPAPAAQAPTAAHARAGKVTRTQHLSRRAPKQPEVFMTDEPLLDAGLACDDREGSGDPRCPLTARAADRLLGLIQVRALEVAHTTLSVIGDLRTDLITHTDSHWGPGQELLFTIITTALFGPIASRVASAAARAAVPLAQLGATKAAWALADVDVKDITTALTMISKSGRTALAHRQTPPPTDEVAFLDSLAELAGPLATAITDQIVIGQMDQLGQLELLARLKDESITGRGAIRARVKKLIGEFRSNRLGSIGHRLDFHGGYEIAAPRVVKVRGQRYMVLCESRGVKDSGLALNGANQDRRDGTPKQTQESLRFVKLVETTMHALITAEYRAQRGPLEGDTPHWPHMESGAIPVIDFDDAGQRTQTPWFGDLYVELQHRTPAELAGFAYGNDRNELL